MWIKAIHVENFGKLSNYDCQFKPGYNEFCEENGWGKSTLSAFIRSMFYGFPKVTDNKQFNKDRERYLPWNGGVYGGNLTFCKGDRSYTIYRTFGKVKTGRQDTFRLIDAKTKKSVNDYSSNIGEELFGINMESFLNTAFVHQDYYEFSPSSEIEAKIGNHAPALGDINRFDEVNKAMHNRLVRLSPDRATGLIHRKINEKSALLNELRENTVVDAKLEELSGALTRQKEAEEESKANKKDLTIRQTTLTQWLERLSKKKEYDGLKKALSEREGDFRKEEAFFKGRVPEKHEVNSVLEQCRTLNRLETTYRLWQLTDSENCELAALRKAFSGGIPTKEDAQDLEDTWEKFEDLRFAHANSELTAEETAEIERLGMLFASCLPTLEEIDAEIEKGRQLAQKSEELAETNRTIEREKERLDRERQLEIEKLNRNINDHKTDFRIFESEAESTIKNHQTRRENHQRENDRLISEQLRLEEQMKSLEENAAGNKNLAAIALAGALALTLIISMVMGFPNSVPAMLLFVTGILGIVVGVVLFLNNNSKEKTKQLELIKLQSLLDQNTSAMAGVHTMLLTIDRELQNIRDIRLDRKKALEDDIRSTEEQIDQLEQSAVETREEITKLEEKGRTLSDEQGALRSSQEAFLRRMNINYEEEKAQEILFNLKADVNSYTRLLNKRKENLDETVVNSLNSLEQDILKGLSTYYPNVSILQAEAAVHELKDRTERIHDLIKKEENYQTEYGKWEKLHKQIVIYLTELGFQAQDDLQEQLTGISTQLDTIWKAREELKKAEQALQRFTLSNPGINEIKEQDIPESIKNLTPESINTLVNQAQEDLHREQGKTREINEKIDRLLEKKAELLVKEESLDTVKIELDKLKGEYRLISQTQNYLQKAKDSFSSKYRNPIKTAFLKYYEMIDARQKESFDIDSDYNLKVEAGGSIRELEAVSRGYQDIAGLCIRFALLDAMYEQEYPCVILDDPFVNFDDRKFENGIEFLKQVGEKIQIFYFTCSKKRLEAE